MNTFIIKSSSLRLLNEEIKKITNNEKNIITFDAEEISINEILEECNYYSLFNEKKYVIVRSMKYFSNKADYKKENDIIKQYLENENPNTITIFICNDINLRNSNVKLIKDNKNLIIIEELAKDNLNNKIKEYLKNNNFKIDNKALELLIKKCISNYDIILNELDKIFLIKKDYFITIDDIKEYCSSMVEDNFEFINAVVNKKIEMFDYLNNLIELKTEPTIILGQIISQFKLIYTVQVGLETYSQDEIAKKLKVHPYRIKLASENGFKYGLSNIENILDELTELDLKIKSDITDKYLLIKLFLLNLIK